MQAGLETGRARRAGHRPRVALGPRRGAARPPRPTQNALATLEWISRAENLVAAGPGTGKSHFAEALAHAAIDKDLRVAWLTLEAFTQAIARAKLDGSVARTVTRICRCDLIVVDIGMLPAGQDAAEAFYRLIDAAYERRSVAGILTAASQEITDRHWIASCAARLSGWKKADLVTHRDCIRAAQPLHATGAIRPARARWSWSRLQKSVT